MTLEEFQNQAKSSYLAVTTDENLTVTWVDLGSREVAKFSPTGEK